uniref:hypothetical protein n=1 Tax=Shimia ponticola TaxID=2582893 RepID=UPI001C9BB532
SEFIALLQEVSAYASSALIAKSGPNTMFEAISLGMPMILFRSGLPQEEWVGTYIQDNLVGLYAEALSDVAQSVKKLHDPHIQREIKARQKGIRSSLSTLAKGRLRCLGDAFGHALSENIAL